MNEYTIQVTKDELDNVVIHSDEVNDILGTLPHWTIRSGSGYLLLLVFMCGIIAWFIQYPEVINARVVLTTEVPPANSIAQASGYLTLYVKDKEDVRKGQHLGHLSNTANITNTLDIIQKLDTFKTRFYINSGFPGELIWPDKANLGELQDAYNAFVRSIRNYQFEYTQQEYRKKAVAINNELQDYSLLKKQQKEQSEIMSDELKLTAQAFQRDSILYAEKIISKAEFDQKKRDYLTAQRSFKNNNTGITTTGIQQRQLSARLNEIALDEQNQQKDLLLAVEASMNELNARLKKWQETYLIISPIDGKINLFTYWANDQYIKAGEEILTVIPASDKAFARGKVEVPGSGKLKEGQKVNIRLDNYAPEEYGVVEGRIQSISQLPRENQYNVIISLPNGLQTNFKKKMEFKQEITGVAEIITEDMRLLERLVLPLRRLLDD